MTTWLIVCTLVLGADALTLRSSETAAAVSLHTEDNTGNALRPLREFLQSGRLSNDEFSDIENRCFQATPVRGTMKSSNKFMTLLQLAQKASKVSGDIMMAGVAEGGDVYGVLYFLACTGNLEGRKIHVFDTWEGLPAAEAEQDIGFSEGAFHVAWDQFLANGVEYGNLYDGMPDKKGSWEEAMKHLHTHKGFFAETMPGVTKKVALLSCDGDMYKSTIECLKSAEKNVVSGGAIYQDDYYTFSGNFNAVQDYRKEMDIKIDSAPMFVVHQDGDRTPIAEHQGDCNPPVDNSPNAGTCGGMASEGGYWIKA